MAHAMMRTLPALPGVSPYPLASDAGSPWNPISNR